MRFGSEIWFNTTDYRNVCKIARSNRPDDYSRPLEFYQGRKTAFEFVMEMDLCDQPG